MITPYKANQTYCAYQNIAHYNMEQLINEKNRLEGLETRTKFQSVLLTVIKKRIKELKSSNI